MTRVGTKQSPEHLAARFAGRGIVPQRRIDPRRASRLEALAVQARSVCDAGSPFPLAARIHYLKCALDTLDAPFSETPTTSPVIEDDHPCFSCRLDCLCVASPCGPMCRTCGRGCPCRQPPRKKQP